MNKLKILFIFSIFFLIDYKIMYKYCLEKLCLIYEYVK